MHIMGKLPVDRLRTLRPLFVTGAGFCGPIYTTLRIRGKPRFIGKRGVPVKLYCDNATNFVGSNSELQELKRQFFDEYNQTEI